MDHFNRREAMNLLATTGALGLAGPAFASADAQSKKAKVNSERPIESTAVAESYGARELFAVVDREGNLRRGLHAVSSRSLALGHYEVVFDRDVRHGAYVASSGGQGYEGVPLAATANVMGRTNNPRGVCVFVANANGDPLAAGFHLIVICPEGFA
jgi:hypothetical protein